MTSTHLQMNRHKIMGKIRNSVYQRILLAAFVACTFGPLSMFGAWWLETHVGYQCGFTAILKSWDAQLYEACFALPFIFLSTIVLMRMWWGRIGES